MNANQAAASGKTRRVARQAVVKPQLRALEIISEVNMYAEGSALVSMGNTRVLCTATVEEKVPSWLAGAGKGWVTAEYGMLPRATSTRNRRERDHTPSRSLEISRLIGRALRASVDLERLGERQITVDCDVLQADGGTRTASINGGMVALALALDKLQEEGKIAKSPIVALVAAVSVGVVEGRLILDLDYAADSRAEVDMNVAMNDKGEMVEIQASAERGAFSLSQLRRMEDLAASGIGMIITTQKKVLAGSRNQS